MKAFVALCVLASALRANADVTVSVPTVSKNSKNFKKVEKIKKFKSFRSCVIVLPQMAPIMTLITMPSLNVDHTHLELQDSPVVSPMPLDL